MIRPREEARRFVFEAGEQKLVIDPFDGGRTLELSHAGQNALAEADESPEGYGSSFWPSPQSDWDWPPPPELDREAWSGSVDGDRLILDSLPCDQLGIFARQIVSVDGSTGVVKFQYEIHNSSDDRKAVAPWQNSRVPPGGLTFFPTNGPPHSYSTLELETSFGLAFVRHDPARHIKNAKAFTHGSEGWIAHVAGDLVLVKSFPKVALGRQAPGEGEIEIYVDGSGRFVEVEQQGVYEAIPPGKCSSWTVRWIVRRWPHASNGSPTQELVELVRSTLRELRMPT